MQPTLLTIAALTLGAALLPAQASSFTTTGTGCPPAQGNPNAEFYEFFSGAGFDLGNVAFDMFPLGSLGYLVTPSTTTWRTPSTPVAMGDDVVVQRPLGWSFPRPGGNTTTVGFCSNGYLWLDNVSTAADFTPTVPEFLGQGARFCPVWVDLNPGAGGQTFADISPASAMFSWVNVPEYNLATITNVQVELFPSGVIQVRYQNCTTGRTPIVGFSRGGNVPDPGGIDLTAAMPFTTGTGTLPVGLSRNGGPPILGATFTMRIDNMPSSTVGKFLLFGFTPMAMDLGFMGMPGCTQYTSLDATIFSLAVPPAENVSFVTPNNQALIGMVVQVQAAVFAPGVNQIGVAASNGGTITVGTF